MTKARTSPNAVALPLPVLVELLRASGVEVASAPGVADATAFGDRPRGVDAMSSAGSHEVHGRRGRARD